MQDLTAELQRILSGHPPPGERGETSEEPLRKRQQSAPGQASEAVQVVVAVLVLFLM